MNNKATLFFSIFATLSVQAQINFQKAIELSDFDQITQSSIAFADIDGDNDLDLMITGNNYTEKVSLLYTNDGNGNYTEIIDTPFEGVHYGSIAFADVDGDNDQDLIITGKTNSSEYISKLYTNDGSGNYTEVTGTLFEDVAYSSISFADVDGDNDQDLLITGFNNSFETITKLYTNNGSGNYTEVIDTTFESLGNSSVAFIDIDGDNDLDLFITGENNLADSVTKLYTNDGNGNFTELTESQIEVTYFGSIDFADIDGDNDLDLFTTGYDGSYNLSAKLYTNDGSGNYTEVLDTPFEEVNKSSTVFADIDGDNDQDLLITGENVSGNFISKLYINDGSGNYTEVIDTPFAGVEHSSIAFTDIDGDNDLDVLITGTNNSADPSSKLYTNDGSGNYTEVMANPLDGVKSGSIAHADIDGDNDMDVLITGQDNSNEVIAKLYTNDENGHYTEAIDTPFAGVERSSIAFADVDGDNDLDVLITGVDGPADGVESISTKLYTNDGSGNYTEAMGSLFDNVGASSVAFADVDGDNDMDLLIAGANDSNEVVAKLYTNDESGIYTEVIDTPFEGVTFGSIAFADIDGDNDQDLLITGRPYTGVGISKLYTNDGSGNFTEVSDTPFEDLGYSSIAFADVDGDNDLDLMMTGGNNSFEFISKLYTNDGSGNYTEVIDTPFEGVAFSSIAFADVDGDNDLDLMVTGDNFESETISKLYTNDGSGNYMETTNTSFEGVNQGSISFADVDSDGDIDLIITGANNSNENISKLYINKTPQTVFATDEQIACNTFTWIDDITYTADNTTAQHTLTTVNGADSIVTLNLTINSVSDLSTTVNVATITANNENATYQWLDCDNNDSAIDGATGISFSPTQNGNYAVEITENGNACVDTTSCVAITTVGLIENTINDVVVYPNPTAGAFNISLKSDIKEVHITVVNMLGRKVYGKTFSNTNSIDLELNEPSGIYFIELRTKEYSNTIRLIKK